MSRRKRTATTPSETVTSAPNRILACTNYKSFGFSVKLFAHIEMHSTINTMNIFGKKISRLVLLFDLIQIRSAAYKLVMGRYRLHYSRPCTLFAPALLTRRSATCLEVGRRYH
jgi:hypothetical protein